MHSLPSFLLSFIVFFSSKKIPVWVRLGDSYSLYYIDNDNKEGINLNIIPSELIYDKETKNGTFLENQKLENINFTNKLFFSEFKYNCPNEIIKSDYPEEEINSTIIIKEYLKLIKNNIKLL